MGEVEELVDDPLVGVVDPFRSEDERDQSAIAGDLGSGESATPCAVSSSLTRPSRIAHVIQSC